MARRRITVIDDSPEVLALLADALGTNEVEVTKLGRSVSLAEISASRPDVLMVDLRLGTDHLPGWELIRHMRADPRLNEVPIVVCSGALDQVRGHGGGANRPPRTHLLPKPFSLDDLDAVLAEALGTSGGGEATTAAQAAPVPSFGEDPRAWFDTVGRLIGAAEWPAILARMEPASWVSRDGHPWRLVITSRGVEVRPELVSPFLRYGNQPMVSAIGLSAEIAVELTTSGERWVDRFAPGAFDVAALGRAMLDQRKLPHDNLPWLFPLEADVPRVRVPDDSFAFRVGDGGGRRSSADPGPHMAHRLRKGPSV